MPTAHRQAGLLASLIALALLCLPQSSHAGPRPATGSPPPGIGAPAG